MSTGWFPGHVNEYVDDEGTSMATPQVSGVLALLIASGLTPAQAVPRLLATADKISCGDSCDGLVDAAAALGPAGPAVRMARLAGAPPAPKPAGAATVPPVPTARTGPAVTSGATPATHVSGAGPASPGLAPATRTAFYLAG